MEEVKTMFDFNNTTGWSKNGVGYLHSDQVVATYGFKPNLLVYRHNEGKLRMLSDFVSVSEELTVGYLKGALLKAGESHYKFEAIYDAIKTFGRVNLKEIAIKEQTKPEKPTAFLYKDNWFLIAPVVNVNTEKEKRILTPK